MCAVCVIACVKGIFYLLHACHYLVIYVQIEEECEFKHVSVHSILILFILVVGYFYLF